MLLPYAIAPLCDIDVSMVTSKMADYQTCAQDLQASKARIVAGRDQLAGAVIERSAQTLQQRTSLLMRMPSNEAPAPFGHLLALGFLAAALRRIAQSDGTHTPDADHMLGQVISHLEQHRMDGMWRHTNHRFATGTLTAIVALSGALPDFEALEGLRGPTGGFLAHRCVTTTCDDTATRPGEIDHWEQEDLPTTALLEAVRIDQGLEPQIDAKWLLARFQRWGGLFFNPPTMGLWAMAKLSRRLGPWEPTETDTYDTDDEDRMHRRTLRNIIINLLASRRRDDGSFGGFDSLLNSSLAVLALAEMDIVDRTTLISQSEILNAWEGQQRVETPFHSTITLEQPCTIDLDDDQHEHPAMAVLHDHLHQATTYEDPHQLITTALACMALHAEVDLTQEGRFLNAPHFPVARLEAATPEEQALQHVRPYCEPSPERQHHPSDPFCTRGRRVALLDAMTSSLDRLGPTLVSPAAGQRLRASVQSTRDDHIGTGTFGLEVRLHGGDDSIDFLWCASRSSRNLFSLLNNPDPTSRLRHLAALWSRLPNEEKPTIAFIDEIWFEFDLDGSIDLPPAFFFGPSNIQRDRVDAYGLGEVAVNVRRVARSLELDSELDKHLLQTADRLERFEVDATVFQTGMMFSRAHAPIRICFSPRPIADAFPLLEGLELHHMMPRCRDLLDMAAACGLEAAVCTDITPDGATSRIGFELYPAAKATNHLARSHHYQTLCERLHECGHIDADRAFAFLHSEGWDELSPDGGCNRLINHMKCLVHEDGSIETKGYIALRRTRRPM